MRLSLLLWFDGKERKGRALGILQSSSGSHQHTTRGGGGGVGGGTREARDGILLGGAVEFVDSSTPPLPKPVAVAAEQ